MPKIEYISHSGSDLHVVNAARVSFGKVKESLDKQDESLIGFLARGCTKAEWESFVYNVEDHNIDVESALYSARAIHTHWTPFATGGNITLRMKMPIVIARQWLRSEEGRVFNEISRRYVSDKPTFEHPELRKAAENVKQGSSDEVLPDDHYLHGELETFIEVALDIYDKMIENGVAPEVARFYLPQGVYTEIIVSGSLYYWARVCRQRLDPHAQKEVREVAKQVAEVVGPLFPVSWRELMK